MAAVAVCAIGAPSQAAAGADIRHREIVDKADGGRLSVWDDFASNGIRASTIRNSKSTDYESRTSTQWELEQQGDAWLLRNEKNATLCLQPATSASIGETVVVKTCNGDRLQLWKLVPEETDHVPGAGPTGWWSLRPVNNLSLAAAPAYTGAVDFSEIWLFRATNSADRLWHYQPAGSSW